MFNIILHLVNHPQLIILSLLVALYWLLVVLRYQMRTKDARIAELSAYSYSLFDRLQDLAIQRDNVQAHRVAEISAFLDDTYANTADLENRYLLAIDAIESLSYAVSLKSRDRLSTEQIEHILNLYLTDIESANVLVDDLLQAVYTVHPGLFIWRSVWLHHTRLERAKHTAQSALWDN